MIAALFVQKDGVYSTLEDVDCWSIERDARLYNGPNRVVAHPPCQLWVNFAALNYKRWGGEHNRPGNDGGCFASALKSVRTYGGVLEHPARSKAWDAYGLPWPQGPGWRWWYAGGNDEYVCEVWQSAYGHKARKRTWLFYKGPRPHELNWAKDPGTHQVGWFDRKKPVLSKKESSATPIAFAEELVRLARAS